MEIFQRELDVVAKNIADPNTDPKKSRKITLTVTLTPDDNREEIKMSVSAKSTVASVKPAQKTIHLGKQNGKPVLVSTNPTQAEFEFNDPAVATIRGAANV